MLVNRRTFQVKRGRMQEVVDLLRAAREEFSHPHTRRIYTPSIAPLGKLVIEIEFENLEGYEKHWAAWGARPETTEFMKKWYELTESGGTNELWNLEE